MILSTLGWLVAFGLLALVASSAWHGFREKSRGPWIAAGIYACSAVVVLTIVGVLGWLTALVLAVLVSGATAGLAQQAAGRAPPARPSVAEAVATRAIPSVMEDAALGPVPEPAELVAGQIPAAAPYVTLAAYIAGFEPEDDLSLRIFMESNAAGSVMVADAWHHFADTCLNSVGLDPAYVAGILEAGDSAGGHGSLLAQIHKRFGVIYAAVKEWVAAHGPLPHKARDFLTGE